MTPNKTIPNDLRSHRIQAGLRQIDAAQALGLESSDRISRWEGGIAMPNIANLFNLAAVYRVKPHELYPELYADSLKSAEAHTLYKIGNK